MTRTMITALLVTLLASTGSPLTLRLEAKLSLRQRLYAAAFSRDGNYLAVGGEYGIVFESARNWRRIGVVRAASGSITPDASKSGFLVATTGIMRLVRVGKRFVIITRPILSATSWSIGTTPDGAYFGCLTEGFVKMYDLAAGVDRLSIPTGDANTGQLVGIEKGFAVTVDGYPDRTISGERPPNRPEGELRIYSAVSARQPTIVPSPTDGLYAVAYSVGSGIVYASGDVGRVYKIEPGHWKLRSLCRPRPYGVDCLAASRDGTHLAIGYQRDLKRQTGRDAFVIIDARSGGTLASRYTKSGVVALAWSPDARTLAVVERDGELLIYSGFDRSTR